MNIRKVISLLGAGRIGICVSKRGRRVPPYAVIVVARRRVWVVAAAICGIEPLSKIHRSRLRLGLTSDEIFQLETDAIKQLRLRTPGDR